jgi:RNAse (barnase) inhibitor barstar
VNKLSDIIGDPEASGVYLYRNTLRLQDFKRLAKKQGLALFHIKGDQINDKSQFLRSVAEILQFPDYFGSNWDALADCLTDMSWNDSAGYVIVYDHPHILADNSPEDFRTLVEIFQESARFWHEEGIVFVVVLHGKEIDGHDFPSIT